jgi:uncharacterized integral membrane protein
MAIVFLALLIIAVAVVFSAQNAVTVTLSFIAWQFSASLAIVVFLAVLAGMVIMGLLWIGASFKKSVKKEKKPLNTAPTDKMGR